MLYRYVLHDRVPDYEARGWHVEGQLAGHHDYWSCLMSFDDGGETLKLTAAQRAIEAQMKERAQCIKRP